MLRFELFIARERKPVHPLIIWPALVFSFMAYDNELCLEILVLYENKSSIHADLNGCLSDRQPLQDPWKRSEPRNIQHM